MKRIIRTHLAPKADPITLRPAPQFPPYSREHSSYKPLGFWYEVNSDWRRWMRDEDWGGERYHHIHEIDLVDCNVLQIRGLRRLDAFDKEYGLLDPILGERGLHTCIDWVRVSEEYDGLEIAPYVWSRRLEFMWYYGWDCASGVIWRPRGATVSYVGPIE